MRPKPKRYKRRRLRNHHQRIADASPKTSAVAIMSPPTESETRLVPYDENLLERSRTQWQFGDWERLVLLSRDTLQHHPDRAKLALLAAAGHLQSGGTSEARQFVRQAQDWGCSKKLISQILVAGVHNSLGRAAAVSGQEQKAIKHFENAIATGTPGSDVLLVAQARIGNQLGQLGVNTVSTVSTFVSSDIKGQSPTLQSIGHQLDVLKNEVQESLAPAKTNPYSHNRSMTPELNKALIDFFHAKLGKTNLKASYIDYLALKAAEIEKKCVGRLATTVQDAVVRQVVAESIETSYLGILEIGSLYGVNLAILYNDCVTRYESVKVIGLDPFEGFYGNAVDALLNTPINPNVFHRNMQLCNVPSENYMMVRHYSTDADAVKAILEVSFNLLIIDGDHSYEGVKFDYETYFPLLEAGGYLIFDDYNAKEWPGVKLFVDQLISVKTYNYTYIGAFSRTAIFRKMPVERDTAL